MANLPNYLSEPTTPTGTISDNAISNQVDNGGGTAPSYASGSMVQYASDAAAKSAGLVAGDSYTTTEQVSGNYLQAIVV